MQSNTLNSGPAFLRLHEVSKRYSVSDTTIRNWASEPSTGFPKPVRVGVNVTAWRLSDLQNYENSLKQIGGGA